MLKDLSDVDINATDRFVYGTIPQIPEDNLDSLPRILTAHNVTLVYLFKKRFKTTAGLFKLDVEVDSRKTVTSYAYFDISKYKFFTTPDYFATDLVNIMKISSSDRQSGSRDSRKLKDFQKYRVWFIKYFLLAK